MDIAKYLLDPVHKSFDLNNPIDELRFLFFSDSHLTHNSPSSRKDDYPRTILNKLSELAKISTEYSIDFIIHGGDLFHSIAQTDQYVIEVAHVLKEFSCPIYFILGNHDIPHARVDAVDRTPSGILLATEKVFRLGSLKFNVSGKSVFIQGLDFRINPKIPILEETFDYNFLVSHQLMPGVLEGLTEESFLIEDIKSSKFNFILLGHDHMTYPLMNIDNKVIVRPGALSRGTKSVSNRLRDVCYGLFQINSQEVSYLQEKVPNVLPGTDVFSIEEVKKNDLSKLISRFVLSLKSDMPVNNTKNIQYYIDKFCNGDQVLANFIKGYFVQFGLL